MAHLLHTPRGKTGSKMRQYISFKKAYDSVRREALYNIFIELGYP
jgi:hypothetical protein